MKFALLEKKNKEYGVTRLYHPNNMYIRYEACEFNPIHEVIKKTLLSAFTFLSAFALRDAIVKTMAYFVQDNTRDRILFVYAHTLLILTITVLLASAWQGA
jgi:hypothetical protein